MNWGGLFDTGLSTANSLIADKQSPWGASPIATGNSVPDAGSNNDLASWLNRGVSVYKAVSGSPKLNQPVNAPDVPTRNSQIAGDDSRKYLWWIVGGVVAVIALVFFIRR